MQVDYLIVGQGISGTLLSRNLLKEGKKVLVIDNGDISASSKVASGIINPVTGKRLVKTWMIDEFMPFASVTYQDIENEHGISILSQCNILDFHLSRDAENIFNERSGDEKEYLQQVKNESHWTEYFRFNYGIGEIAPTLLVDVNAMLSAWREHLLEHNALLQEEFTLSDCIFNDDNVSYKDVTAQKIIFCNGAQCAENPFFNRLPWSKDKGEVLIASIEGLPANNIYKQGINIVPWHSGLFWIGATHDWKFTDMQPSLSFLKKTQEQLDYWLRLPYKIIDHLVAARPTNIERRPFVGCLPGMPLVGIFNGMGTKGCSVAPYFAHQFAQHLVHNTPLMLEVDVKRFTKILSR